MGELLRFSGVGVEFQQGEARKLALSDISLSIAEGEYVAVIGTSGSGKSTLLRLAAGLLRPTTGTVAFGGASIADLAPSRQARLRREELGIVFQNYNLIDNLTAAENVALPLELAGQSARGARPAAIEALQRVGVGDRADVIAEHLSGGEQQRVALARALVGSRRLLLADEPTGALDSFTGDRVMQLIRTRADSGATVLLVTHDERHAGWADRVVRLHDGRIASIDARQEATVLLGQERGT